MINYSEITDCPKCGRKLDLYNGQHYCKPCSEKELAEYKKKHGVKTKLIEPKLRKRISKNENPPQIIVEKLENYALFFYEYMGERFELGYCSLDRFDKYKRIYQKQMIDEHFQRTGFKFKHPTLKKSAKRETKYNAYCFLWGKVVYIGCCFKTEFEAKRNEFEKLMVEKLEREYNFYCYKNFIGE